MYRAMKSDDDERKSADHVVMIVPGSPPNSWENKHVATVVKHMKKPLQTQPKVGRIENSQNEVLMRRHRAG